MLANQLGVQVNLIPYIFTLIPVESFRLFIMLRQFPIESRGRQKKLYEVSFSHHNRDLNSNYTKVPRMIRGTR